MSSVNEVLVCGHQQAKMLREGAPSIRDVNQALHSIACVRAHGCCRTFVLQRALLLCQHINREIIQRKKAFSGRLQCAVKAQLTDKPN